jgi:hypothetical protein
MGEPASCAVRGEGVIPPYIACSFPDGTLSAYICELRDEDTYSRWMALLRRSQATENLRNRYQEMGIDTHFYRIGDDILQAGWSYGEYGIRGPEALVQRLVSELLRDLA